MYELVENYFGALGLGGLFVGVLVEAMGVPFPGGALIIFSGVLVDRGILELYHAALTAVAGFNAGAATAFFIGRHIGEPFFLRYGSRLHLTEERFSKAQEWLERSAAAFILVGRFIPMVSNLIPYVAGLSGLGWGRFLFYTTVFSLCWTSLNLSIGILFSKNWERIFPFVHRNLVLSALFVLLIVILYGVKRHKVH